VHHRPHRTLRTTLTLGILGLLLTGLAGCVALTGVTPTLSHPILFVTQVPIRADFTTIGSTFGNHLATMQSVGRGGDLWIRYPDGELRNLTREAGYGNDGFQGEGAIAVRDPSVHWDGDRALFSMVVGAPDEQYATGEYRWQLYEITGLGRNDTPVIAQVANQPAEYNNVSPLYGSDDRILFTSDRPRGGESHLYPQLDEYEEAPVVTGIWSLEPESGDLFLLNHAPSGDFTPILDSFGRVVFTQWDHLQRDQQADADNHEGSDYGTFDYADESADAERLDQRIEVFPEPRAAPEVQGTNLNTHTFNHFFPWTIAEDGRESEVLNHLGRHELHAYLPQSINVAGNLTEFYGQLPRNNSNPILNLFQIEEDPAEPGRYLGIDAPEFGTHASGQIVALDAPPERNADDIAVVYLTHPDTADIPPGGARGGPDHSGRYRDPLPLASGELIAAHTFEARAEASNGPSRYDFRLRTLTGASNGYLEATAALTGGIEADISYWDPDTLVTYRGPLWELNPVEVRPRARPPRFAPELAQPELNQFEAAGVDLEALRSYLIANELALAVVRDATTRDDFDLQQPFNLAVSDGTSTVGAEGRVYDVAYLQLFQADQLRGIGGIADPRSGRRVLARHLHDPAAIAANPADPDAPPGSVAIAADGSVAAFVPARRALSWQLTDADGTGVVRERYWITFQPGEIRVCGSCHGVNVVDQTGDPPPQNAPLALLELLQSWSELR
jgi:hypothetical protein